MTINASGDELLGYAGILMGKEREELRPSRTGNVFLAYDLKQYKAEARAHVLQQSLYWAGWVTALALGMWLVFHFLLTRRTARLVHAAEELAAGNLAARSGLKGTDELGRLSRAFDAMALKVADTQTRLRKDLADRMRSAEALRVSEASYRAIFDASEDAIFVHDIETGAIVDVNHKACVSFGYSRDEFLAMGLGEEAKAVCDNAFLFEEFLVREKKAGRLKLELKPLPQKTALLHGHCHQKAFGAMSAVQEALSLVPDLAVSVIESSCCGMAGSFGYEAEHYQTSIAMAELSLLPAVRKADPDALIVADGTSCRHQIADGSNRQAVHVAEVLAAALS